MIDFISEIKTVGQQAEEIFWGLSWPWRIAVIVGVCMLLGCALVCVWSMAKQLFWCALVVAFVGLGVFLYFAFETKAISI